MTDKTIPSNPPPSYEDAAAQHSVGAVRPGPPIPKLRAPLPLDIPILNLLRGKRVILASASPRRKQLLVQVHLSIPPSIPVFLET
jgi:hypothetical protein